MAKVRVVIAEGRTLFRQGLAALLNAEADFQVVGEAADADAARRVCIHAMPDLILLASALLEDREEDSLSVIAGLRVCCPTATIVVLGEAGALAAEEAEPEAAQAERRRALRLGAAAYLHVQLDRAELLRALRAVAAARGGADVEGDAAPPEDSAAGCTSPGEAGPNGKSTPAAAITERERAVISLIAQGLCNKEIAHRLGISIQTVKNHVSHLLEKLALADRTQLAVYALEQGLGGVKDEA
ncbi:MAG TPA: response regulator transcription factor [Chthonomonadaceae bacterium]|nr:response regulator transcription factor [Chthonomonadaceae bacterium]